MPSEINAAHAAFVERVGLMTERDGLPRIAGRILGLLLITPGALSIDDIAAGLGVSRASVSTDARRLVGLGKIERVGRPGDRKDYYQLAPSHHLCTMEEQLARTGQLLALLVEARALPDLHPVAAARIDGAMRFFDEMATVLTAALERWRATPGPAATTAPPTPVPELAGTGS